MTLLAGSTRRITHEKDKKVPDAAKFVLEREDHTVGNLVRMWGALLCFLSLPPPPPPPFPGGLACWIWGSRASAFYVLRWPLCKLDFADGCTGCWLFQLP